MITFTINLSLVGIIALAYYVVGVVAIVTFVLIERNSITPPRSRKATIQGVLRAFLFAPLFPYILISEYFSSKRSKNAIANYRAQREAELNENIYA